MNSKNRKIRYNPQPKKLSIIPSITLSIVGLILFISAFFVVYFMRFPEQLPFSWEIFGLISSVNVVFIAAPMIYGAWRWLGRGVWLLLVMALYAMTIETFAVITGWPYSAFEYGQLIGGKIGIVPWTVGFSWLPIMILAWVLVRNIPNLWARIGIGAVLMTTFDLVLDPGATALGFWIWENSTGFYNVPWMNFFGWIVSSILGLWIWETMLTALNQPHKPEPETLRWLSISGLISLIFWVGINGWLGYWITVFIGIVYVITATSLVWKSKY